MKFCTEFVRGDRCEILDCIAKCLAASVGRARLGESHYDSHSAVLSSETTCCEVMGRHRLCDVGLDIGSMSSKAQMPE